MAKRKPKAPVDPQTQIANLTKDLGNAWRVRSEAQHRQRLAENELARALVTIEALQHMLLKERADNDIPF
ncbi:hypothetical protein LJR009_001636 [Bosea sp. LjRoot9]